MLDQLSLRYGSRERRYNVNVVGNAADVHQFGADVAADCCEIRMYALPHVCIEPRFTIFRAEDDVDDDFTEGLRHAGE